MKPTPLKPIAKTILIFSLIALLVGCGEKTTSEVPQTARSKSDPALTSAANTFYPTQAWVEMAVPVAADQAAAAPLAPATAYPAEGLPYPGPVSSPTPIPAAMPFQDCARTPGIAGCDPSAPRLAGHIAFYDADNSRLVNLNLKTGEGWTVPIPQPNALEWSPDGSQLLVRMNNPLEEPYVYEYLLFEKEGKLIRQFTGEKTVYWQPQGAELRTQDERKVVRSPAGAEAWLETTEEYEKILHFRPSGTAAWETAALDIQPMEWQSELYGWIPGTPNIIIARSAGSAHNEAAFGSDHHLFNTQTGELYLFPDLNGHFLPQFVAIQEPNLAIIQLRWGLAKDTLAILDGKTGKVTHPLPDAGENYQPYTLRQIAWQPGKNGTEGSLVMMVHTQQSDLHSQPVSTLFPKSGIYLYQQLSGQAQLLREVPEETMAGNFHWTADGEYLLYSLGPVHSPQSTQTGLYLRQISTGKEWLMMDHLVNPDIRLSYISWNLIAVSIE